MLFVWVRRFSNAAKHELNASLSYSRQKLPAQCDREDNGDRENRRFRSDREEREADFRGGSVEHEPDFSMVTVPARIIFGERDLDPALLTDNNRPASNEARCGSRVQNGSW